MQSEPTTVCFAAGHPAFAGHFPGRPMVPGVLLLDAALHAAVQARQSAAEDQGRAVHCQIASAKFLSPVVPGEPLTIVCTPTAAGHTRFDISGIGRPVATGTFVFQSVP
ncbi:hotdog domain-containing protein [Polaromonas sp.]|uniref:hotdog domain-containing protein n=1 Tax=Polaromonas sp. TaxID=1869339 RepID=UPI0024883B12|nr:hotdog domain-containing protein [Polaromonas sp.]MDI1340533.1 3-hydroxyacyl-ACP dehydratase [Polaromonas sp.]